MGCIHSFLEDDHHLTISDMQWEMAAYFSLEASEATLVCALQQLEMQKVRGHRVPQQLTEEYQKNCTGGLKGYM